MTIGSFIKKHVFGNVTAKLMALAMAVALWLYAYSFSLVSPSPVRVPVKVLTPEGWSLGPPSNLTVEVTLRYPRRVEAQADQALRAGLIRVECSASPEETGSDEQTMTVPLKESSLISPRALGVTAGRFDPTELQVKLIRETTRSLPVRPIVSRPPPGYQIAPGYPYPIPSTVRVRGRKDVISRAEAIDTEEIDISSPPPMNATEWPTAPPVRLSRYVVDPDGVTHAVSCDQEVQCRILLVQAPVERTLPDVPINILAPPDFAYTATLGDKRSVEVRVRGPVDLVNAVKAENIILYVDVGNLKPSVLPATQPIHAHIAGTPGASEITIKLDNPNCPVKIAERSPG